MKESSRKYVRNCPSCNKELCYSNRKSFEYSINGRRGGDKPSGLCISCAKKANKSAVGERNPMFGKKHSEETRRKIKEKRKFQVTSEETRTKMSVAHSGKYVSIETRLKMSESFKNRTYSEETRKKMKDSAIRRVKRQGLKFHPSYNQRSIPLIEEYGKKNGYNFQHAENGGEFYIKGLGYWVDAYDKEKNVVLEIDERYHYNPDGSLKEKDQIRQKQIEEHLKCKFIRIRIR